MSKGSRDLDLKTADVCQGPSLLQRAAGSIACEWLQPFWETVDKISSRGRGYSNIHPELNGEAYFLDLWAKAMKRQSEKPVVFDIGANEGDFTQMVLQRSPANVYCFEPNPETANRLRTRLQPYDSVTVNGLALGSQSGSIILYDQSGRNGTGLATALGEVIVDVYHTVSTSVEVPVSTVDEFVSQRGIKKIHLMKIDTEGFEYPVLAGAKNSLAEGIIDWIQFEFNVHNATQGYSFYKFFKLLSGFDLYRLLPRSLYPVSGAKVGGKYPYSNEVYKYANFIACRRSE